MSLFKVSQKLEANQEILLLQTTPAQQEFFIKKELSHQEAQLELEKWLDLLEMNMPKLFFEAC